MARPTVEITRIPATKTITSNYGPPSFEILASPWQYIRTYSGTVTPGFSSMSARQRKKLPVNAHSVNYYRRSGTSYTEIIVQKSGGNTYIQTTVWSTMNSILYSPDVLHLSDADTKARSRLASVTSKLHVNLAQAMGERKQTMNLIATNCQRVAALALAIKRADFSYLAKHYNAHTKRWAYTMEKVPVSKRLSTYWLEYQYGWKPLLQDIRGATDLIASHASGDNWHNSARSSATARKTEVFTGQYADTTWKTTTRTKFCVRHSLSSADRAALSQTGIDNPALLAWELLPYSFVVDWFLPVGNYLQALNAFAGFEFYDGWVSRSTKLEYTEDRNKIVVYNPNYALHMFGWGSTRNGRYDRERLTSYPAVGFPSFKNPVGGDPVTRFATAFSLLRVLFK